MKRRKWQSRRRSALGRGAVRGDAPLVSVDVAGRYSIDPADILPFVPAAPFVERATVLHLVGPGEGSIPPALLRSFGGQAGGPAGGQDS